MSDIKLGAIRIEEDEPRRPKDVIYKCLCGAKSLVSTGVLTEFKLGLSYLSDGRIVFHCGGCNKTSELFLMESKERLPISSDIKGKPGSFN